MAHATTAYTGMRWVREEVVQLFLSGIILGLLVSYRLPYRLPRREAKQREIARLVEQFQALF